MSTLLAIAAILAAITGTLLWLVVPILVVPDEVLFPKGRNRDKEGNPVAPEKKDSGGGQLPTPAGEEKPDLNRDRLNSLPDGESQ